MEEKFLEVKAEWSENFNCGFIQIINQTYRSDEFFNHTNEFICTQTGITLCSNNYPNITITGLGLYVRGKDIERDLNIITIYNKEVFDNILIAIENYNIEMQPKKKLDYCDLHRKVWLKLHRDPTLSKNNACIEVCNEEHLELIPPNNCFLCAEALNCKQCNGFWGKGIGMCSIIGSYYKMWENENDLELKSALAKRIAYNTKPMEEK